MWYGKRLDGFHMSDIYDFWNCVVDFVFSWSKTAQANSSWRLYLQNFPERISRLESGQIGWRCIKELWSKAGTIVKDVTILGSNHGGDKRFISS